jgi:hypothetical protein
MEPDLCLDWMLSEEALIPKSLKIISSLDSDYYLFGPLF